VRRCCQGSPCLGSCGLRRTGRHSNGRLRWRRCRDRCLGLLWLSRRLSNRGLGLLGLFADSCRGFFGLRSLSLLCGLFDGRSGSDCLGGGFSLCCCKLLVDLVEILLTLRNVVVLVERRVLGLSGGRGRLLGAIGRCRGLVELFLLLGLLSKVTEDVVQYEVAVGLLREDECLGEALVGIALVGDLADDLNDDVGF
jgi:hypothetical protein